MFGLTGGIGSGKSAAAGHLRARGLPVVNADELSREAVSIGSAGLSRIAEHFGPDVLERSGALNRAKLGEIVFSDAEARAALDAIVHPFVRQLAADRFAALDARSEPLACYEVPLLYEVGLERVYQPVIVVTASDTTRRQRLATRDGFDDAQISARIAAQMPLADKVQRADFVIDNDGTLAELYQRTDHVLAALCAAANVDPARYPLVVS